MNIINAQEFFESRDAERAAFLNAHLPAGWRMSPLAQDWGSRRYFRIYAGERTYVMMESVPDHLPTATMGHKLSSFIKVAKLLKAHGVHAPDILEADEREGYVLLEDMGDTTMDHALDRGGDPMRLYAAAADVLASLRQNITLDALCGFPRYKDSHIRKGRQRIVDWYLPATKRAVNGDEVLQSYLAAWDEVAVSLPPPPIGFIHGDFRPGNVMILKDGTCGVLDFQDAMAGPLPYDLANMIEDIRRDIPQDVHEAILARYCGDDEAVRAWFRVMATQFHCRIAGQVIRLAVLSGRMDLLGFMPRVQTYLRKGLEDPVLAPLARWMKDYKVDLTARDCFDPDAVRPFIRADAF